MADTFRIDIVVSGRQAEAGVRSVEKELDRLNKTAAATNGLLRGALQVVGVTSGVVLIQRLGAQLVDLADSYTQVQNRLSAVVEGTENLSQVTSSLLDISNRSRTGFEATAQLFARTALATKDLGTSQQELLGITESVNKAIILSGASAKEANNGLIQLSQAISSNRLAGDELRSVLEQLPVVADVIARQLGVTRGQLRELGKDGKITADVILSGFRNARAEIEQRFARTVPTVAQSFEVLRNNAIAFVGALNQTIGASALLSTVLQEIGKNLDLLVGIAVAAGAVFAAGPVLRFAQSLRTAAIQQQQFNAFKKEAIVIAQAQANAAVRADVAISAAAVQRAELAVAAAEAELVQVAASTRATIAIEAQARATVASISADLGKVDSLTALAQAQLASARAAGTQVAARNAEQALFVVQSRRAEAVRTLALAEGELAVATFAVTRAQLAETGAIGQVAGAQAVLATQTKATAAAQRNLNAALTPVPGLLSRIAKAAVANPFGIAVTAGLALAAVLTDLGGLSETFRAGISGVGFAIDTVRGVVDGLAFSLGVAGDTAQSVIRLAGALGAALVAIRIAAASAGAALVLGLGAALLAIGELNRALDKNLRGLEALGNAIAANDLTSRIVRTRQEVERLAAAAAKARPDETTVGIKLVDAQEKLNALLREQNRLRNARKDEDPLAAELAEHQNLIRLFGLSRRERELELDLIRERKKLAKEGVAIDEGSENEKRLRESLRAVRAAEDLAGAIDAVRSPAEQLRLTFSLLNDAQAQGRINAEEFSGALNRLRGAARELDPLSSALQTVRDDLKELRAAADFTITGDAQADLLSADAAARLSAANREVDDLVQSLRDAGVSEQALQSTRFQGLLTMIRQREELRRQNELRRELLEIEQAQQFEIRAVGLDAFERDVLTATDALEKFAAQGLEVDTTLARNSLLAQEFGGILNNLQSPLLAQAQAQSQVADQIARANEALQQGVINGAQFALVMEDLDFKARAASTSFSDGFTVAVDQMRASINEATLGQQLFTSTMQAATAATSQFVQEGTVDFRKLALNVIDSIAQIITQILVLKAVQALGGFFGGGAAPAPSGFGGGGDINPFRADGGPVQANRPFIVGEEGPELFVPGRHGNVVSNDQVSEAFSRAGGGQGAPVVVPAPEVTVTVVNQTDPKEFENFMASDAGGRLVVNQVQRNPTAIRRGLGT